MVTPLRRSILTTLLCGVALASTAPSASAQVGYEPTYTRAIVAPLALRDAPLNTNVTLVLKADKDMVLQDWPSDLPAMARAGWAVAHLTTDDGEAVAATTRVSESLGGVRVDIAPTANLAPNTAYTVRIAAAVPLPSSQAGQELPVTRRVETRFTTGSGLDEQAPAWTGLGQINLRTATAEGSRGECSGYLEELTFRVGQLTDDVTPVNSLRVFLAPVTEGGAEPAPSSVLLLTGSNIGSYTVTSCDGAALPWGELDPTATNRMMQLWAEDLGGHRSEAIIVGFPKGTTSEPSWTTPGQVLAEGEELPADEPTVDSAPDEGDEASVEADETGESSNMMPFIIGILALLVLGGIVLMKKRG